jgi:hypothetical protein
MDFSRTPGSEPFGFPDDKHPEDFKPTSGCQASSNQSVENEQVGFDRGVGAAEAGPNLLPVPGMGSQPDPAVVASVSHSSVPRWAARIFLVIEVVIWIELGMILVVVPWTHAWSENSLILDYPRIRELLSMNFVRGAVTGIGLLDIWAGVSQAIHYKDPVGRK